MPTNWPCPSKPVNCPNFDNSPLINNSSEAPDPPDFLGEAFGPTFVPPLGTTWGNPVGIGNCFSTVSQEAADLCAVGVVNGPNGPPGTWTGPTGQPTPPHHSFRSESQSIDASCPDGSIFPYVVPAGMFTGPTQADANEAAIEWGMQQANLHLLCLSELPAIVCQGAAMNLNVVATSDFVAPPGSNVWFTTGDLPDGVIFTGPPTGPATLTGTPETAASFGFTIGVTLPNGDSNLRFYEMTVAGITNATLPDAQIGQPYTQSLETVGFSVPMFSLSDGSLPPGLTLDGVGNITGTPTGDPLGYAFTVTVQDGFTGFRCDQTVRITTSAGCGAVPTITKSINLTNNDHGTAAFKSTGAPLAFFPSISSTGDVTTWNLLTNATQTNTPADNNTRDFAAYDPAHDKFWTGGSTGGSVERWTPSPLAYNAGSDWPDAPGESSFGLGYNSDNGRLYYVSSTHMFTINTATSATAGSVTLGGFDIFQTPAQFNVAGHRVYAAGLLTNGPFTQCGLIVYSNADTPVEVSRWFFPTTDPADTFFSPYALIYAPTVGLCYLGVVDSSSGDFSVLIINPATGALVASIPLNTPASTTFGATGYFDTVSNNVMMPLDDLGFAVICTQNNTLLGYAGSNTLNVQGGCYAPGFGGLSTTGSDTPNKGALLTP